MFRYTGFLSRLSEEGGQMFSQIAIFAHRNTDILAIMESQSHGRGRGFNSQPYVLLHLFQTSSCIVINKYTLNIQRQFGCKVGERGNLCVNSKKQVNRLSMERKRQSTSSDYSTNLCLSKKEKEGRGRRIFYLSIYLLKVLLRRLIFFSFL